MGKALKILRIVLKTLTALFVGILLVYNVYALIYRSAHAGKMPKIFGYSFASVVSGSMEDALRVGDFIVTRACAEYCVGDVIMFYDAESGAYITHRIIMVSGENYLTKGDANETADDFSVPKTAVAGKVVSVWRGFGKAVTFLQSPLGMFSAVGGVAALWILFDVVAEAVKKKNEG